MQLLQLCEPLFQYVCRLNRIAAYGCEVTQKKVDGDIRKMLNKMKTQASVDSRLAEQFEKVLPPLVFFVDYMIRKSQLSFNNQWRNLAYTMFREMAGDERFFCMLDEELAGNDEAAAERVAIYYTCLGLGFKGLYLRQPDQIKQYMTRAWSRISDLLDSTDEAYLCPETYQYTDKRPMDKSVKSKLMAIAIIFVILLLFWLAGSFWLFNRACNESNVLLEKIRTSQTNTESENLRVSATEAETP